MTLVPFKKDAERGKKVIDDLLKGNPAVSEGSKEFSIEKLADGYRIAGIECGNNYYDKELSTELLPAQIQDVHAERARNAKPNEFRACSAPLIYAIFKTLYENRDNEKYSVTIEEARNFLQKTFQENFLITLSRVQYNPQGLDWITQDYKQRTKDEKQAKLFGSDGLITKPEANLQDCCQAILGTKDDVNKIDAVFKWATNKNSCVYRINHTPQSTDTRIVLLGVNHVPDGSEIFLISANCGSGLPAHALGMRPAQGVRK